MRRFYAIGMILGCLTFSCAVHADEKDAIIRVDETVLELTAYSTDQIEPLLPLLEEWMQREFVQYPYLWIPTQGEYSISNVSLLTEKQGLVTVVRKGEQVVGIAAGAAFDSQAIRMMLDADGIKDGQSLFEMVNEQGFDPSQIFYMNYFLTAPEHRNDKDLVNLIYNHFVDFAHEIGKTQICYFEDPGLFDHYLKPKHPTPIEPWRHVNHRFRNMNIKTELSWPTAQQDGSVKDQAHHAEFFIQDI